jgi:hypothetical protein
VPVGDEKVAVIFMLQRDPVLEYAVVVTEMELTCGPHAGQHAVIVTGDRTQLNLPIALA